MGEVKRWDFLDWGSLAEDLDGDYVLHSDYAALEAKLAASEAACAAKDQAIRRIFTPGNLSPETRAFVEAALSPVANRNWIDATGAVEGRVQKLPVPASGWAGGTSLEHVTIPREWAGSRVLIVRVVK